ncbi:MAG TPA: hypothetical protein VMK82_02970, partial [Steroidobacteraceae bacterium]|nr:hypothetical protein [Steroidobacteraceae bacterium]
MLRKIALSLAGLGAMLALASCGGGDGGSTPPPANVAPTANAGAAQSVLASATVTLNGTASSDPDGSIASFAWAQLTGTAVTLSNSTIAQPSFVAPPVVTAATLTFSLVVTDNRGAVSAAAAVTITVNPSQVGNVTVSGAVRFARVPFLNSGTFGLNYAAPVLQPSRGVIVRALNATTQAELATGVTSATGAYSLSVTGNTSITIQVVARMQRDAGLPLPRWDVRAQDGLAAPLPYAYTTAAFNSSLGTQNVDIPLGIAADGTPTGSPRASGPFAVLDTIYTAIQAILAVEPAINFPALIVDWGAQSVGTFFTTNGGQRIALMSDLTEDTDEFDQHVVAHEFGHYIERNFSRSDSIGGAHGLGDRLDMRVAFGEGFGYAFAGIVLNDPFARDSFVLNGSHVAGGFNVNINPRTTPPGEFGDQVGCWCSE